MPRTTISGRVVMFLSAARGICPRRALFTSLLAKTTIAWLSCTTISAATYALLHTFDDPTPSVGDEFGSSVDIDGNLALVGAPRDNTSGRRVGQAHLFDITTGALLHTFDDPIGRSFGQFGSSVALDNGRALIRGGGDDTSFPQVDQVHLFDATTGYLLNTFSDPNTTRVDHFGAALDLDGDRALIGDSSDDTIGLNVGQAHLFDVAKGTLVRTFDDPTPTGGDEFGFSVALDGDRALIGAREDNTFGGGRGKVGQAHLFDITSGVELQRFDDPTVTTVDLFATSVAIDGNWVLIGAVGDDSLDQNVGQVHLFNTVTGLLAHTFDDPSPSVSGDFGASVALDGNHAIVGVPGDSTHGRGVGQAHLFLIPEPCAFLLALVASGMVPRRRRPLRS